LRANRTDGAPDLTPAHFLSDKAPLYTQNAAAAIILVDGGRYLLQLRDDAPKIFYPGHWGCFGGAVNADETPLDALCRELSEELDFRAPKCHEFICFDFDLDRIVGKKVYRAYFEVSVSAGDVSKFVLREGAAMKIFDASEMFDGRFLSPFDSFALWLHFARTRLR
jgi:8-oxo-dGTP pyrophosphatase MutT (NUDIX family)